MDLSRLALVIFILLPLVTNTIASEVDFESCEDVSGAHWQDDKCVCIDPDQVIDASKSQCLTVAFYGYGSECNDTNQCVARMNAGAICYENKCRCTDEYHYLHGYCWRNKKFGEKCRFNEECYNYHESDAYECVNEECACAEGAYKYRDRDEFVMCRRLAEEGQECETTSDCNGADVTCDATGTTNNDFICVNKKNARVPSAPARSDIRADSSSTETTVESTDTTTEPFVTTETTTETSTVITTTDVPCSAEGEQWTESGVCICKNGYFRPSGSSQCVPELGEPCSLTEDRPAGHKAIESASCRYSAKLNLNNTDVGVWACLGGFLPGLDNRMCHKTREHAMNCPSGEIQCAYYGGQCVSGSCSCPPGLHYATDHSVCWPSSGLNETCAEKADCAVTTSNSIECIKENEENREDLGICTCKSGYHPADGDCRVDANALRDPCTIASDCLFANGAPWITCEGKRCSCAKGYFSTNTTFCETGVGGACESDLDCAQAENTMCSPTNEQQSNKCQCQEGFVAKGNYKACVPVATTYGQECEETEQCTALTPNENFIDCINDICECPSNRHFKKSSCWLTIQLNNNCSFPSQCIANNSICLNGYCTCDYNFKPNGMDCVPNGSAPFGQTASPLLALLLVLLAYISS